MPPEPLTIDKTLGRVYRRGQEIPLSMTEYQVLMLLSCKPGQWISTEEIRESIWNGCATLDVIYNKISKLRRKVGRKLIENRRKSGYRLAWPQKES